MSITSKRMLEIINRISELITSVPMIKNRRLIVSGITILRNSFNIQLIYVVGTSNIHSFFQVSLFEYNDKCVYDFYKQVYCKKIKIVKEYRLEKSN